MKCPMPSVILLSKCDRFCREAQRLARGAFGSSLTIREGGVGEREPDALSQESPDYLISFLSPWIVRKATLDRCGASINFHPGPVEYPGIGCYNFALYDEARTYGAVCHHMLEKVDTGPVIAETRFEMTSSDTVETLKLRTMGAMLPMFAEIIEIMARGDPLPAAATHWTRVPYTRGT